MQALQNKLIALGAVLLILPWFFSRKYRVVRRALIHARPDQLFPLINDLRNWPRWTAWSKRETMHLSYEGAPAGVGAIQNWKTSSMEGTLRIVQSQPDSRIAYDLSISDGKYLLEGIIVLDPVGDYTRVTWIGKWDGGRNPYAAYFNLFMKCMIGRDFSAGLEGLRALVEAQQS